MLKERRLWLVLALAAGDAVAGAVALVGAYLVRFRADMIPAPLGIPPIEPYLSLLMLLLPLHALSLRAVGLYEYRHERTKADEAFVVVQGATLATLLLVAGTFFFRTFSYSRWFMLVFWAFDVVAVFGVRMAIRDVVRALRRHGRFVRRALVVGAGELGQEVVRRLRGHPEFGVRVVGYLDDRFPVGERLEGKEVLGGCEAVTRVLTDYRVNQIFLALPLEAHHEVLKVLNAIEGEFVDVKMVPDVLQFVTLRAAVEELEGLPVISLAQSPITGWARLLKRGMDLALAGLGLIVLAPALGLIALLIRMSSPGPVLYRQERTGLDGRSFDILKFRTMPEGTEEGSGPVWSRRRDRRPTRLGRTLRRFSLDELPQLWNVLAGDMSLVGPRPERPYFVHQFKTQGSAVHAAPQGQGRAHGVGPGERAQGRHLPREAHRVRSLLHPELVAGPGREDHAPHALPSLAAPPPRVTMRGLILAGGRGTRLRPITYTSAKQLVPVANKPILFYGLEALAASGLEEVGIVVGDTHQEIRDAVGDGGRWGVRVTYIPQPAPLGLAHAVLTAEPFLRGRPFVMYLGDNLIREPLAPLVARFQAEAPAAQILLAKVPNPQEFGVAVLEGARVVRLVEKPTVPPSDLALVGIYMFDDHVFDAARAIRPSGRGELEITDAIQHLIDIGLNVRPHVIEGWWKDTGKIEDLLDANRILLDTLDPHVEGFVEASEVTGRVVIERGARVVHSVVRGPAIIGRDAVIENAYVGPFTAVGDGVTIRGSEIEHSIVLEGSSVTDVGVRIESSLLGRNARVYRAATKPRAYNLMLGDRSQVGLV